MKSLRCAALSSIVLMLAAGCGRNDHASGFAGGASEWKGKPVVIQFRRDALGAAANLPIPPETGGFNGASVTTSGTLVGVAADGLVIEQDKMKVWIPREVILSVSTAK